MIPLLHDFDGETVLVVGGGPVGARRARTFAPHKIVVATPIGANRRMYDVLCFFSEKGTPSSSSWKCSAIHC